MKNIETIDMANKTELAKILARRKWCEGCALTSCGTKGCADYIKTWMDKECEAEENPPADNVNHPAHYTGGKIEVIDFIEDKELGFHLGNAVKYISRAGRKNPDKTVEDLRKAAWYINRQIQRLER